MTIGPKLAVPACLAAMAGIGIKANDIRPIVNPPVQQENLNVHEESATASLMGQFRTSVSAWLWLRTDLYLHNGTEMRPLSEAEQKNGVTVEDAADDGHEKLHAENEITAVPPKERDFRGYFGDVEREVSSYKDMHNHSHNEPEQALPLFRLMTWLDPQFVQAWTTGAMVMARERDSFGLSQSVSFLKEGWAANPDSLELPGTIGMTLASHKKDLVEGASYLDASRQIGLRRLDKLSDQELEALQNTYRWLAMCYRNQDLFAKEKLVLVEGLSIFKDDVVMQRMLSKNLRVNPIVIPKNLKTILQCS